MRRPSSAAYAAGARGGGGGRIGRDGAPQPRRGLRSRTGSRKVASSSSRSCARGSAARGRASPASSRSRAAISFTLRKLTFRGVSRRIHDDAGAPAAARHPRRAAGRVRRVHRAHGGAGADSRRLRSRRAVPLRDLEIDRGRSREGRRATPRSTPMLDLFLRSLRDAPRASFDRIIVDDDALYRAGCAYLREIDPHLALRARAARGRQAALRPDRCLPRDRKSAAAPRLAQLRAGRSSSSRPRPWSRSTSIRGSTSGRRRPEETVLRTNLEAAEEIARQLRLRDLGGIIVVDFIDMDRAEDKRHVLETLEKALQRDRSRTKIVGLSELGLLQLTRKRTRVGRRDGADRAVRVVLRLGPREDSKRRSRMRRCSRSAGWRRRSRRAR